MPLGFRLPFLWWPKCLRVSDYSIDSRVIEFSQPQSSPSLVSYSIEMKHNTIIEVLQIWRGKWHRYSPRAIGKRRGPSNGRGGYGGRGGSRVWVKLIMFLLNFGMRNVLVRELVKWENHVMLTFKQRERLEYCFLECVEIATDFDPPDSFPIECEGEVVEVVVEYQMLPPRCAHCKNFGHSSTECTKKIHPQNNLVVEEGELQQVSSKKGQSLALDASFENIDEGNKLSSSRCEILGSDSVATSDGVTLSKQVVVVALIAQTIADVQTVVNAEAEHGFSTSYQGIRVMFLDRALQRPGPARPGLSLNSASPSPSPAQLKVRRPLTLIGPGRA
ncbi:hypothetical protein Acr_00g0032040 [Actinidia rufa]|uniref:DUF4283 domain-containing protein n=1 Tax=Actinidia rufa TaxID=165716 RepID=A0A7J0DFB2_9ERIC|nr:hypothetical protein Acr_00g0032040 [Actinidia rufa]